MEISFSHRLKFFGDWPVFLVKKVTENALDRKSPACILLPWRICRIVEESLGFKDDPFMNDLQRISLIVNGE